jgi:thiamine-monophosphate kinase
MRSEFDFINRIRNRIPKRADADIILGIGDDTAILREQSGRETLVTVDFLVEDVDFKIEYTPSRWLGHKALAVSMSDVAAMGGTPRFSLLTLGIPGQSKISNLESEHYWEEFLTGYFSLAEKYSVSLIGGDISSTPDRLAIDSIVIGHCPSGKAVRRSGARAGDKIYLTGAVGASAAGLKLLSQGERVNGAENNLVQNALRRHLKPEPRVDFGKIIGESGLAHAMIDVSDGLAQDLLRICQESRLKAVIDFELVPVADEVKSVTDDPEAAFLLAVNGGEDFELLLTAGNDVEDPLLGMAERCELKLTGIGEIIESGESSSPLLLRQRGEIKPLLARGYDHFLI